MGSEMLPQFAVLQSVRNDKYVYYHDSGAVAVGYKGVFDPLGHIEIERPKDDRYNKKYVHLRFRHNNKYWAHLYDNNLIYGSSTQPEEDTSKPSCTLFEPKIIEQKLYLIHVQTKRAVQTTRGIDLDAKINTDSSLLPDTHGFNWVNCDDLVKLPKFIALKGDNGKYLKSVWFKDYPYLQFSSDDPNEKETAHEVHLQQDGHVSIKSVYFGKYWRMGHRLYAWLRFHSQSHECPVCKAVIKEEELIPLYGRGNTTLLDQGLIPRRPAGQRPATAAVPPNGGGLLRRRSGFRVPSVLSVRFREIGGGGGYGSFGEGGGNGGSGVVEEGNLDDNMKKILFLILAFVVFDFLII